MCLKHAIIIGPEPPQRRLDLIVERCVRKTALVHIIADITEVRPNGGHGGRVAIVDKEECFC